MKKLFLYLYLLPIFLSIIISIFFIPYISNSNYVLTYNKNIVIVKSDSKFIWPIKSKNITSKFGYRKSPTEGASSYHGGVDIAAKEGTDIYAIADGIVKYAGWYGANGYSVLISHKDGMLSTYAHVSNDFLVSIGDEVKMGETIARVGPRYIEGPANNPYKDSNGNSTNGATTGPHLHFALSVNGKRVDPLEYMKK